MASSWLLLFVLSNLIILETSKCFTLVLPLSKSSSNTNKIDNYDKKKWMSIQDTTDATDATDATDTDMLGRSSNSNGMKYNNLVNRKESIQKMIASSTFLASFLLDPSYANAAADCMTDCLKNCKLVAPKDPEYCNQNCKDYCEQPDREDGLSGSIGSARGETGILGINTVVKGEDKPPILNLPGLDFNSDKGKKLIGY